MMRFLWILVLGCFAPLPLSAEVSNYHLSQPRLLADTLTLIQENYVDPDRARAGPLLKGALDQIQKAVPEILTSCSDTDCSVTVGLAQKKFPISGMTSFVDLAGVMQQIFAFIELHYHGQTKLNEIEYAAIDGMLDYLDPHSNLLTPKIYNEFKIGTKGNFGGIGIVIGSKEGELTVIAPLEGTPAFRAGIKAKDHITQIGDESTINMSLTEAVEKLRGAVGTPVTLTVERPSRNVSFNVTLKRAIIKIQSVQSQLMTVEGKPIAYIKVKSFQENSDRDMIHDLQAMQKKAGRPLDGLVLDLRNNPGGLLNQSISMADYFIKKGAIVSTVGVDNREFNRDSAHDSGSEPSYPIIVLINEGSASASEIVAGALQANGRAKVIGFPSFGKGSVQQVFDLQDDSALKLTVAEYLTAAKYSIQSVGITPDITLIPMTAGKQTVDLLENEFSGEKDLERHLERPVPTHTLSTFKLLYFNTESADVDDDAITTREYTNTLDLQNDFAVELAGKLLVKAPGIDDASMAQLTPLLKKVEAEEMDKLIRKLEQLGIDWGTGPAGGRAQLQISFKLQTKGGQDLASLKAGEEGQIVLRAHNAGSGPLYRLIAYTKLDEPLFANKEFVFGRLMPGASRTWTVPVKLPKSSPSMMLPVKLYFSDLHHAVPQTDQILVSVSAQPRPQFAFRFSLGTPVGSKVADSEPLPRGKIIPLTVSVKNLGPGISQDTVVSIRNTETKGAFLEVGRVKLGKLAPNQVASATLKFRIEPAFQASTLKLDLSITDADVFETLLQPLVLTVGAGRIEPQAGPWYQGPRIALSSLKMPITTTGASQVIQGVIEDDRGVKDMVIFVGEQKIAYQPNPSESQNFPFKATLPLKAGSNYVTISARDTSDLGSRYLFTILRNSDKSRFWRAWLE